MGSTTLKLGESKDPGDIPRGGGIKARGTEFLARITFFAFDRKQKKQKKRGGAFFF